MRNKKLYVVGEDTDAGYVGGNTPDICQPITAKQAKKELKNYGDDVVIYKLVPVSPEDI